MGDVFDSDSLKKLHVPDTNSSGEDNGQVTIVGGSTLFHGAPILSLTAASRIVDMVFFASPEPSVGEVANKIKSKLSSFVWVPWEDVDDYIEKSDALLIGPGFMRFASEKTPGHLRHVECDRACQLTKSITQKLLTKFADKKWVIDAGSLQIMSPEWIPQGAIITPNRKEYEILFGEGNPGETARKYKCVIVLKGPVTYVYGPDGESFEIHGGNAGLTKGGSGDSLAGIAVGLLAKNDPLISACASSYLIKATADSLYKRVGTNYNADDLAAEVFATLHSLL